MAPSEILLTIYNGLIRPHRFMVLNAGVSTRKKIKIIEESHANYMFEWLPLSQRAPL